MALDSNSVLSRDEEAIEPRRSSKDSLTRDYGSIEQEVDSDYSSIAVDGGCARKIYPAGFWTELKSLMKLTWPIILTMICQMIMGPISLIFCGHLGDKIQLDGAALAISMINSTVVAVGQGLGTACDTFFSQSFGSNQYKQAGLYLQKALLIFGLVLIVILAVHLNMTVILVGLGQDLEVCILAGRYMLMFIPGTISFFMYVVLSKFVQNQNLVWPNVVIGAIANGLNALFHYILLYQLNTGIMGSAVSQSIGYFLMFILTLLYIVYTKIYKDSWEGWNVRCLYGWGKFCRLAIPGMLMVCLEFWSFNIGIFLAGLLGTTQLGAQSVLLQLDSVWCQVPMGVQVAVSIRVGQYLGAGSAEGAKTAARLSLTLVFLISVVMCTVFLSIRFKLTALFTNVVEVAELAGRVMPIVSIYMFFDGFANACKGILYGTGRQIIGAVILFVSFYCMALPLGVSLMFKTRLGVAAFWFGLAFSLLLQAIVFLFLVFRTNWTQQVRQAEERLGLLEKHEEMIKERESTDSLLDAAEQVSDERRGLLDPSPSQTPSSGRRRRRQCSTSELLAEEEPQRISRHSFVSVSLSVQEIKDLLESSGDDEFQYVGYSELYMKRLLVLIVMLAILGVGVATRILIRPSVLFDDYTSVNGTTVSLTEAYDVYYTTEETPYVVGGLL